MTVVFSVVMPAYNAESYIAESIDSALAQTVPPIEVLVIDDGSEDATSSIVRSFGPPVRLIQQENLGPGAARNRGADTARGDWLAFLDADDIWEPSKLERQSAVIDDSVGVVYCDRFNIGEIGGLSSRQSDGVELHSGSIFEQLIHQGNFITLSSACIQTRLFSELGGFDPSKEVAGVEDWELWLRASRLREVAFVEDPLVHYRCHAGGISKNVQKMFRAQEVVLDRVLSDVPSSTRRKARTSSAMISAWFCLNSGDFGNATQLYGRALRFSPLKMAAWKGIVKSGLRKK